MNEENDKKPGEILYRKAMKYYILLCLIGFEFNSRSVTRFRFHKKFYWFY